MSSSSANPHNNNKNSQQQQPTAAAQGIQAMLTQLMQKQVEHERKLQEQEKRMKQQDEKIQFQKSEIAMLRRALQHERVKMRTLKTMIVDRTGGGNTDSYMRATREFNKLDAESASM